MAVNIRHVEILKSEGFCIGLEKWKQLKVELHEYLAEVSLFDTAWLSQYSEVRDGLIYPKAIWWQSEGSGFFLDTLEDVLKAFDGTVDLVLTWDNGDRTGYRLTDHELTEPRVQLELVD